jgi:kumamolisin
VALALGLACAASSSQARPHRVVIDRAAVLAHGDRALGALPHRTALRGTIVLRPRDQAALTRFIATVTDRGSAHFGDYLAPGAFGARFGPTAATRAAVSSALRATGLRVGRISADGLLVPFTGSTGIVDRAFATSVEAVRLASGRIAHATSASVSLPSQIAGSVQA